MDFPRAVSRISFFVNAGIRFVTEMCKMRAFVDLWDELCETRYGVTDPSIEPLQVPRGATLASIAASLNIPDAEAQLRLMNGYYPRGEPRVGDWIKIVR